MTKIEVKGNFEGLDISIEENLDPKDLLGAINGVRTDINYYLINMINTISEFTHGKKLIKTKEK